MIAGSDDERSTSKAWVQSLSRPASRRRLNS